MAIGKKNKDGKPAKAEIDPVDASLKARLSQLDAKLDTFEQSRETVGSKRSAAADATQMGKMFRYIGDFASGVIVGALLGWGFDKVAGTSPWGLIVLLLLGFAAGIWNLVKSAERDRLALRQPHE